MLLALGGLAVMFDWPADGAPSDGEGELDAGDAPLVADELGDGFEGCGLLVDPDTEVLGRDAAAGPDGGGLGHNLGGSGRSDRVTAGPHDRAVSP